jgi:predicted metal-dependent HD superfamily phosphohydrolase
MMTIKSVKSYCSNILQSGKCKVLPFHNFAHTKEVIDKVFLISDAMEIQPKEAYFIAIAACFHDTGFSQTYVGHKEVSKKIATQYMKKLNFTKTETEMVLSYIDATKMHQNPQNIYAEVHCDAHLFHLGTPKFLYRIGSCERNGNCSMGLLSPS